MTRQDDIEPSIYLAVKQGYCVACEGVAQDFLDYISEEVYHQTGLCQGCQNPPIDSLDDTSDLGLLPDWDDQDED